MALLNSATSLINVIIMVLQWYSGNSSPGFFQAFWLRKFHYELVMTRQRHLWDRTVRERALNPRCVLCSSPAFASGWLTFMRCSEGEERSWHSARASYRVYNSWTRSTFLPPLCCRLINTFLLMQHICSPGNHIWLIRSFVSAYYYMPCFCSHWYTFKYGVRTRSPFPSLLK